MPNASMIKYRLNSSQWPIRKRLETMLEPLKRNEQPSPLKRNEQPSPLKRNEQPSPLKRNEQPSRLKRNELQMPRRLLLKKPRSPL
jgi:hypothetical protein